MPSGYYSPSASPLLYLQNARQSLLDKLPPKHDLRRRVQIDDHGELLTEQPAGRPPAEPKMPPARKRGRYSCDPAVVLKRLQLRKMWDTKCRLQDHDERDRISKKMLENRKKLRMERLPYRGGRGDDPNDSTRQGNERAAQKPATKNHKGDARARATENSSSLKDSKRKDVDQSLRAERKKHLHLPHLLEKVQSADRFVTSSVCSDGGVTCI